MPPVSPPLYPYQPLPPRHHRARTIALILGFVAAVAVVITFYHTSFFKGKVASSVELTRFSLVENGTVSWYELSGSKVVAVSGPTDFDGNANEVTDATPTMKSGDTPVLAGKEGSTLAVIRSDGTFVPFLDDSSPKSDLTVDSTGTAVFEEPASTTPQLVALQLNEPSAQPVALGVGFSPAISASGSLFALDSTGLVQVQTDGSGNFTLLGRKGLVESTSSIAPDASTAALFNTVTGQVDVFSIIGGLITTTSYVASVPATSVDAVGFVSPSRLVLKEGNTFVFYDIGDKAVTQSASASL